MKALANSFFVLIFFLEPTILEAESNKILAEMEIKDIRKTSVGILAGVLVIRNISSEEVCLESYRDTYPLELIRVADSSKSRSLGVNLLTVEPGQGWGKNKLTRIGPGSNLEIPAYAELDNSVYFYFLDGTFAGKARKVERIQVGARVSAFPCLAGSEKTAYEQGVLFSLQVVNEEVIELIQR